MRKPAAHIGYVGHTADWFDVLMVGPEYKIVPKRGGQHIAGFKIRDHSWMHVAALLRAKGRPLL